MHALHEFDGVRSFDRDGKAGAGAPGAGARRCIATGDQTPVEVLVRFVVSPSGEIVPDLARSLPGRGIWVSARRDAIETAVGRRLFARAARQAVVVDPALADRVEALLAARCIEIIGLARRGGGAVTGFEKVRAAVRAGRAGVLLFANDAAEDGRARIEKLGGGAYVIDVLGRRELGQAFGRDEAVHGAVNNGRLAHQLKLEAARLSGLRRRSNEG